MVPSRADMKRASEIERIRRPYPFPLLPAPVVSIPGYSD
jgi:hypothetical protein